MARLGDIFTISSGGTPNKNEKSYYVNGTIPWVKTGDLKDKYVHKGIECITEEGLNNSSAKLFPKDTVLVAMYGATIGACSILSYEASTNQACAAFLPREDVFPEYLYYFLSSKKELFVKDGVGGAQPNISAGYLKNVKFKLISLDEQQKVIDRLSKVDDLISFRKQQLSKLDELVKSRFIEMLGEVVNSHKYSGVPLGTICSTLSGGTPTTKVPEYYQGDIPWISTPYLGNNHINGDSAKAYITEDAIKNSATHLIPANTILFGIRVGVGKSSIIDEPMCANQDIVALMGIDTNKYNLLFVKHALDSYQSYFDSIKKGATILGITTDDLKKVLIPNVDIGLQNQFATFVEQTDKSKFEIQKSLEKLETLKKALMQKYFG